MPPCMCRTRRALNLGVHMDLKYEGLTPFYRAFLRILALDAGEVRHLNPEHALPLVQSGLLGEAAAGARSEEAVAVITLRAVASSTSDPPPASHTVTNATQEVDHVPLMDPTDHVDFEEVLRLLLEAGVNVNTKHCKLLLGPRLAEERQACLTHPVVLDHDPD